MNTYFTDKSFQFLRRLERNNSRAWFHLHKADYETQLREPFQKLISDLQPDLLGVSEHYRADPRSVGGSLFRIHRDTRFSKDKTPYKTWSGARFFHARSKTHDAPSFYLHLQPGQSFVGAGLWHPQPESQRRIRQFILDNPAAWKSAVRSKAFQRKFSMAGASLLRSPRGLPADHELLEDLKRKDFVAV
ncbi:MAG: TIGR02453 family protein, partial [Arenimonas sp.]